MHIEDQAIIISTRRFQESASIIDCFSREHGVIRGLIKSQKEAIKIAPASLVHFTFKARLETQLGYLKIEIIRNYASLIGFDRIKLKMVNFLLILLRKLLYEKDQNTSLYDSIHAFLENLHLNDDVIHNLKLFALLELRLLKEAGYGLDLNKCVASGTRENLIYLSPKSGCAVSEEAGKPYHNKLFEMPAFYIDDHAVASSRDVIKALEVNKFFLQKRIFEPNNINLPQERDSLSNEILPLKTA